MRFSNTSPEVLSRSQEFIAIKYLNVHNKNRKLLIMATVALSSPHIILLFTSEDNFIGLKMSPFLN